jgi:hypothetical protein
VFEQRLRYGLDIGPEVINEALDDGFRQASSSLQTYPSAKVRSFFTMTKSSLPLRRFSGRSAARTVLRGRSNAETTATERNLTFIVAPRIDPCAIDHCADPPRDGSAACDIECGVLYRVAGQWTTPRLGWRPRNTASTVRLGTDLGAARFGFRGWHGDLPISRLRPKGFASNAGGVNGKKCKLRLVLRALR